MKSSNDGQKSASSALGTTGVFVVYLVSTAEFIVTISYTNSREHATYQKGGTIFAIDRR